MSVMDTLVSRRTYRRFAQKAVPQDVVDDIVEAVRLSSCGANRQAVRLVVVNKPEAVAKVQPLVKWAAYLPPEQGTPKADELPTLYVAVVQDTSIPGDLATDTGIALANMTLAAWDKGVGRSTSLPSPNCWALKNRRSWHSWWRSATPPTRHTLCR